jgi:hypothetical protein
MQLFSRSKHPYLAKLPSNDPEASLSAAMTSGLSDCQSAMLIEKQEQAGVRDLSARKHVHLLWRFLDAG